MANNRNRRGRGRGKGGGIGSNQHATKGTSRARIVAQDAAFEQVAWQDPDVDGNQPDDNNDDDQWFYTPPVEAPPNQEEVTRKLHEHRDEQDELHARLLGIGHGGILRDFRERYGAGWESQYENWCRIQQGRSQLRATHPGSFPALIGLVDHAIAFNEGAPGELRTWAADSEVPGKVMLAAHREGVTANDIREAKRAGVDPARYLNLRALGLGHWRATRRAKRARSASVAPVAAPDPGTAPGAAPDPGTTPAPVAAVGRRASRRLIRRGVRSTLRGSWRFTKFLAEPFLTPTPPQRRRRR